MRMSKSTVAGGLFGVAALVVALGLLAGGLASASPASSASSSLQVAKTPVLNTSQSFSFSSPAPTWNAGNLCTPAISGSVETCSYSGGGHGGYGYDASQDHCGCKTQPPLTYNFSGAYLEFVVDLSNVHNQPVYLNFVGHNDTILIVVSGCQGGTLNVSVLSQTTLTLNVSASDVKASIYLYSDGDHYVGNLSGDKNTVWTYFVSARPRYDLCPSSNNTHTDSWVQSVTGKRDYQGYEFVNGVGYGTALNSLSTGDWNTVAFENTTNFECSWSWAPAPTCHHGYGTASEGAAVRQDE